MENQENAQPRRDRSPTRSEIERERVEREQEGNEDEDLGNEEDEGDFNGGEGGEDDFDMEVVEGNLRENEREEEGQ